MALGIKDRAIESLGLPIFKTDLYMPHYRLGQTGAWKYKSADLCLERGYFSGLWAVQDAPVMMRERECQPWGWETWMSLFPHEIESQELPCRHAKGHTVVMGLGMGWAAINIALNPAVRKVTVVERDADVIALFDWSEALKDIPEAVRAKIGITQADALDWHPEEPVDFLYADIWREIQAPCALGDMHRMQANVQAKVAYFWGQELLIHARAARRVEMTAGADKWAVAVGEAMEELDLPLLTVTNYPALVAQAAGQRQARRCPPAPLPLSARLSLRPFKDEDIPFLRQAYAASREEERTLFGWPEEQWQEFVGMQFEVQHAQYMQGYRKPTFDIIVCDGQLAGRLYVDHAQSEIRLIDIIVMPEFRRQGIAAYFLRALINEAEIAGVPLSLHVEQHNPIMSYYKRLGFVNREDRGVYQYMERQPAPSIPPKEGK